MARADRPLVAIFGAGRNGSTLLVRSLDASPGLWVHPVDVVYLTVWDDLARRGAVAADTRLNARTRRVRNLDGELSAATLVAELAYHWEVIEREYLPHLAEPLEPAARPAELLLDRAQYRAREFLPALLEASRRAYDRRETEPTALVFKTLETPFVADYARVFPTMRFIHIVRDPVANYSSTKRSWTLRRRYAFYHWGHDVLRTFLDARWLPHARLISTALTSEPERHRLVRYEDLCADPVRVVGELCDWLGVERPAQAGELTVLGGRRVTSMPSDPAPSQPGVEAPARVVADMAREFGYDEVVTERERELIERLARPFAGPLGYSIDRPAGRMAGLGLWLRWLPPDDWERLHVRSHLRLALELARRRAYIAGKLAARR